MRLHLATAAAAVILMASNPAKAQIGESSDPAATGSAIDDCGILPATNTDPISADAAAFGQAYVQVDQMMALVEQKSRADLQRLLTTEPQAVAILARYPALAEITEQTMIALARRCYPVHLARLQSTTAQIIAMFANAAQLREITRFTLSAPGRRLQRAGYDAALDDTGEIATMTAAQRRAFLLRKVQEVFAAMSQNERAAVARFGSSPAGDALAAAQPELDAAIVAWMTDVEVALRPRAELESTQAVAEYLEQQGALPPSPAGTP